MIDIGRIRFDGKLNYQNGLNFYFRSKGHAVSFLVEIIGDRKRKIRVTMQPDINHERPHIHINEHGPSFAVDSGELLAGNCDYKTQKEIKDWILRHQSDLQELWIIVKKGGGYGHLVDKIQKDKDFSDFGFRGVEPPCKTYIGSVIIWHDGDLITDCGLDNVTKVICEGDMYVALPSDHEECNMSFEALNGNVTIKKRCS